MTADHVLATSPTAGQPTNLARLWGRLNRKSARVAELERERDNAMWNAAELDRDCALIAEWRDRALVALAGMLATHCGTSGAKADMDRAEAEAREVLKDWRAYTSPAAIVADLGPGGGDRG